MIDKLNEFIFSVGIKRWSAIMIIVLMVCLILYQLPLNKEKLIKVDKRLLITGIILCFASSILLLINAFIIDMIHPILFITGTIGNTLIVFAFIE